MLITLGLCAQYYSIIEFQKAAEGVELFKPRLSDTPAPANTSADGGARYVRRTPRYGARHALDERDTDGRIAPVVRVWILPSLTRSGEKDEEEEEEEEEAWD
ncbi:unnamed protein product [Boreogadus saida]